MADIDKAGGFDGVKAERKPVNQGLRNFLKAIAAGGVGTALFGAGYLTGRRSLEEEFRQKFTEKMEQIHQLEQAIQDITSEKKELQAQLEKLSSDYDRVKADYNRAQDVIRISDSLETETAEALSLYRNKEQDAINELYRIVASYAEKLGGDRVKAEKATADILSITLDKKTTLEQTISEKQQEIEKLSEQVSEKQKKLEDMNKQLNELRKYARIPINENTDFSSGLDHWSADHHFGLPTTDWGYDVKRGEYGEIWIENPNDRQLDLVTLAQGPWTHPDIPKSKFYLRDNRLRLEADVMIVEDQVLPHTKLSYTRVAIAFDFKKIDGSTYSTKFLFPTSIFSEYDIYQRNNPWGCETKEIGTISYHVDQLSLGQWRHYSIDINDFCINGFGTDKCGGWGKDWHDQSYVNQWYLVVENQAAKTRARIRNVQLYEA